MFLLALFAIAVAAGSVASTVGFGIGSLLTPLLALTMDTGLAVAIAAVPHAAATALRCWRLRRAIDRRVLGTFGLASAAGGLVGGFGHGVLASPVLTVIFALLLLLSGVAGLARLADRVRLRGTGVWLGGILSGLFGGLVGNQGGIRSAALLAFPLPPETFVATATAAALLVDMVRVPVYVWTSGRELVNRSPVIGVATAGVLIGTLAGEKLLGRIPEPIFRRIVSLALLILGIAMLMRAISTI